MSKLTDEEKFVEAVTFIIDRMDGYSAEVMRGKLNKIRKDFPELIRTVRFKSEGWDD